MLARKTLHTAALLLLTVLFAACSGQTDPQAASSGDTATNQTAAEDGAAQDTVAEAPADGESTTDMVAADSEMPAETEYEDFDSSNFSNPAAIDNPYLPLQPGTQYVYEGITVEDGEEIDHRLEFTVTDLTKEIGGVTSLVTWIVDYSNGELVEKEISFYAQDDDGNVWYMGEHPEEFEDGEFVTAPTWLHGIDDARAGIAMTADPQTGTPSYSQGWGPAVDFRDRGQVSETGQETCVPTDCYTDVVLVDEFTEEEPNAFQVKYYAPGVGNVRVGWKGEDAQQEELELISLSQLSPEMLMEIRALALELEQHAYEISPDVYGLTPPSAAPAP